MIDPENVPPVESNEMLARFVLYRSHVRADGTLKPDAFVPHPYTDLSVSRHLSASEAELWAIGDAIALGQSKALHGRGDFRASTCLGGGLFTMPDPVVSNPNHAVILGWPATKGEQKSIAQQIAAVAQFHPRTAPDLRPDAS